jgi:putative methionine-R-sulfoxide reductase with GAF domain
VPPRSEQLLAELERIVSDHLDRLPSLAKVADVVRKSGGYRWAGVYDVDRTAGVVKNIAWSGPGAPEYPTFPITNGLTGAAIAQRRTVNVGNVARDPRYLTAFGTTQSEIIVPIFDRARRNVIGTIDVESERLDAFGPDEQTLFERCAEVVRPLWQR